MTTVERTRTIDAPRDEVWATLADYNAISTWAPTVDHSCPLGDRTEGVGAVRRIQAGRVTLVETVERWQAPTLLAYRIDGLPPVVRSVVSTWTLEATGPTTQVTLTIDVDAGPRPPQKLVARFIGRRLASANEKLLEGLATHLHAGAAAAPARRPDDRGT